jgi:hypothetical protein
VLSQTKKPNQHFNAYYQDNALLIQFALVEFIAAHHLLEQIKALEDQCFISKEAWPHSLKPLLDYFGQLLGSSHHEWLGNSIAPKGYLTKLKNYCWEFSKNAKHKQGLLLYTYTHQTWLVALQNKELLLGIQHALSEQAANASMRAIKRNLELLQKRFNRVSKQILRMTCTFIDNENVLFLLFRKKERLVKIYGDDFLIKLAQESKQDIFQLLVQKYAKRGFSHLLATLNS